MTVLVLFDTKTREVRRYDSRLPHGITHEGDIPEDTPYDLADVLRAIRDRPTPALQTDAHTAWLKYGDPTKVKPWRPRHD